MSRHRIPVLTASAILAAFALPGIGLTGCGGDMPTRHDDHHRPLESPIGGCEALDSPAVNLGDLPIVFAPNVGQSPGGPPIFGIDLGAGTMAVSAAGVRLDLLGKRGIPDAVVTIQHLNGARTFLLDPATRLASTASYLAPDASVMGVANYGGLVATKVYPGVNATLGGTMRKLATSYRLDPGVSPATIRWAYEGASRVSVDPVVESLSIAVANGARTLSLGPPTAYQLVSGARTAVSAHYVVSGTTVGLSVGAHDARLPLFITTELLHSPYFEPSGTASINGATYVVGASLRVTAAATGRDAYLASIDPATGTLGSTTFIVGSDDDEAHAVAAGSGGLLVVGATASNSFPALPGVSQPQRIPGGHDAFVLRLGDSGDIVAGTLLGSGDAAATGVVEGSNGDVIVAGTTSDAAMTLNPEAANFTTVLPTRDSSQTTSSFFVAAFDNAITVQSYLVPFQGPPMTRPRVWGNCVGDVMVGMPIALSLDCTTWPDLTYSMRQYGKNFAQDHDLSAPPAAGLGVPPGGFGYHALRWRFFEATDPTSPNYVSPAVTLSFSSVYPNVPKWGPSVSDATALNSLESAAFTPVDPPGGWASGSTAFVENLALTAAFAEWMYGSPTYTHRKAYNLLSSPNPYYHGINIEKSTFDVCVNSAGSSYAGEGLDTLCSFPTSWVGNTGCSGAVGGAGFMVKIKDFAVTEWDPDLTWFLEHMPYAPFPTYWYDQWYDPGIWICDPPDGDPQGVAKISEAADRLSGLVTADIATDTTRYVGGVPQRSLTGTVTVRAADLH